MHRCPFRRQISQRTFFPISTTNERNGSKCLKGIELPLPSAPVTACILAITSKITSKTDLPFSRTNKKGRFFVENARYSGAGERIRTVDSQLGKLIRYHCVTPAENEVVFFCIVSNESARSSVFLSFSRLRRNGGSTVFVSRVTINRYYCHFLRGYGPI